MSGAKQKTIRSPMAAGLWERKHRERMHGAIWLFGWLCSRQTRASGFVLAGHGFTYPEIGDSMGESRHTIEGWMWTLRDQNYIEVKYTTYKRLVIRIVNQKKYPSKQMQMPYPPPTADKAAESGSPYPPPTADHDPSPTADHPVMAGGIKREFKFDSLLTLKPDIGSADALGENKNCARVPTVPSFTVFWEAYPRKIQRREAMAVWINGQLDSHLGEILGAIGSWKRSDAWDEERFIPYPKRFLGGLWKDPPPKKVERKSKREQGIENTKAAIKRLKAKYADH